MKKITTRFRGDRSEIVAYNNKEIAVYVRRAMLSDYDYNLEAHWHEDIELLVALSGCMDYNIGGEIVHLKEGEGIFVNAHRLHYGFSDEHTECDMICVLLHPLPFYEGNTQTEKYILPLIGNDTAPYFTFSRDGNGAALFQPERQLFYRNLSQTLRHFPYEIQKARFRKGRRPCIFVKPPSLRRSAPISIDPLLEAVAIFQRQTGRIQTSLAGKSSAKQKGTPTGMIPVGVPIIFSSIKRRADFPSASFLRSVNRGRR